MCEVPADREPAAAFCGLIQEIACHLAAAGSFDLVCYGHSHSPELAENKDCKLLNPGELMGMNGSSTFAWYDTDSGRVEFEEVS